jgi:hypothetical protein
LIVVPLKGSGGFFWVGFQPMNSPRPRIAIRELARLTPSVPSNYGTPDLGNCGSFMQQLTKHALVRVIIRPVFFTKASANARYFLQAQTLYRSYNDPPVAL